MSLTLRQRASWTAHLFKAVTQQHHRDLRPLFVQLLPVDGLAIDVGAHAGQFSKLFASIATRGAILAFEPSAYARSIMEPALRLNRVGNVSLRPLGLSDFPGRLTLHTPLKRSSALGYGTAHLGASEAVEFDQSVELTTLDAFAEAEGLTRVDLIKADIEGWEMRALKGGEALLRRFRPALYLEIDAACLARAGDTPEALFDWLGSLGYVAFRAPALETTPVWDGPGDYLFTAACSPQPRPSDAANHLP